MKSYTPYTYLIGWSQLNVWYYGSRTAKIGNCLYESGCHPDELWKTYFSSSKHVKEFRKLHGEPNVIEVRRTFNSSGAALFWETKVIRRMNLPSNKKWLNRANVLGEYVTTKPKSLEHRKKLSQWQLGLKRQPLNEATKKKISLANKGKVRTTEMRKNISLAGIGKHLGPCSDERAQAISEGWKKRPLIKCPYCGVSSICAGSMKRWHFENCIHKNETIKS